jgi:hypothetical protein
MTHCIVQGSGAIELYFYGEVDPQERASIEQHLKACADCRQALDELATIRAVLSARPDIAGPPGGDWTGFMTRLQATIDQDVAQQAQPESVRAVPRRPGLAAYVAIAALLALVTMSVLVVLTERRSAERTQAATEAPGETPPVAVEDTEDALAALGEQHFERSKLVVLGLATRDPQVTRPADWSYERELASRLLTDTRLYRQSAEQHGMGALAGVMRDLELVLLEASMSEESDEASLERLQRLIRRRDLITKMNVVGTTGL